MKKEITAILSLLGIAVMPLAAEDAKIDFVKDIQPIFEFHCVSCHD